MKTTSLLVVGLLLGAALSGEAQLIQFGDPHAPIPDGDAAGLVNVQTVLYPAATILDVNVLLVLTGIGEGGFHGDLYVGLQHESGYAVLLNRPGRRENALSGYADSGLSITFDDEAVAGDVHAYRFTLSGSHLIPLSGPLTGAWAPDARSTDPDFVFESSPRDLTLAGLRVFRGSRAAGQWVLFVADLEAGGQMRLESWGLEITTVPEPESLAVAAGVALLALAAARLRRRSGGGAAPPA
jgi:hypothetical protein